MDTHHKVDGDEENFIYEPVEPFAINQHRLIFQCNSSLKFYQ